MYFIREHIRGEWKLCKFSDEEVAKIQAATVKAGIRALARVKAVVEESKADLKEEEIMSLFNKVAPSYDSIALDLIRKRSWVQEADQTAGTAKTTVS